MNPLNIFNLHYLFEISVESYMQFFWVWFSFFVILIVAGIVIGAFGKKIFSEMMARSLRGLPAVMIWYGLGGLVLLFFRINSAPYLSMRIWFLLYAILFLVLAYFEYKKRSVDYKKKIERKAKREVNKTAKKYLPKRKK